MQITNKDIEKLARLSRLELTAEEKAVLSKDLAAILDFVKELQSVNISRAKIDLSLVPGRTREDKVEECSKSIRDLLLQNAPERAGDLIKVKPVF